MRTRRRELGLGLVAAGVVVQASVLVLAAGASAEPGNKGTVKIGSVEVDSTDDASSANHPHVGNPFTLSWYGFDAGSHTSTVAFEAQPPSGTSTLPLLIGSAAVTFTASGEGGALNHVETYQLDTTGLTEHEVQGFHVKLTVTGVQGPKHKTFWIKEVQPTESSSPTATPTTESPTPEPTVTPTTESPTPEPTVLPTGTTSPTIEPTVLPTKIVSPSVSPSVLGVKKVRTLPRTGPAATTVMMAVGLGLVLAGVVLVRRGTPRGGHAR